MNVIASVMLVNKAIRPVTVEYDPDIQRNNNPNRRFMTLDAAIKKDDLVIVPTSTRHGFTIAKVSDIDFAVDFNSPEQWGWLGGKFDKGTYDEILTTAKAIQDRIAKAQENKMRRELMEAAGLGEVDFTDLDLMGTPRLASPRGTSEDVNEAPVPEASTANPGTPPA